MSILTDDDFVYPRDKRGRFTSSRERAPRRDNAHAQAVLLANARPVNDDLLPRPRQVRPFGWDDELDGDYAGR